MDIAPRIYNNSTNSAYLSSTYTLQICWPIIGFINFIHSKTTHITYSHQQYIEDAHQFPSNITKTISYWHPFRGFNDIKYGKYNEQNTVNMERAKFGILDSIANEIWFAYIPIIIFCVCFIENTFFIFRKDHKYQKSYGDFNLFSILWSFMWWINNIFIELQRVYKYHLF